MKIFVFSVNIGQYLMKIFSQVGDKGKQFLKKYFMDGMEIFVRMVTMTTMMVIRMMMMSTGIMIIVRYQIRGK